MMCPAVLAACLALGLAVAWVDDAGFEAVFALGFGTAGHAGWGDSLVAMRSGSELDMGAEKRRAVSTRGASMAAFEATFCEVCLLTSA
jgi:hypothetical protein